MNESPFTAPAGKTQLSFGKIVRMSVASLRLHLVSSFLQCLTIAATAAFLVFVAGEIIAVRLTRHLPTAEADPAGKISQLLWILAVSLLVCVISNVIGMLLSVTKRFREIGTMKCLGAFDRSILALFLVEATILGGTGALAGALAGLVVALASVLTTHGTVAFSGALASQLGLAALGSFLLVTVLSFLGAAYPAWTASRMLPIEAMRTV
jgi:ABC-type multidrug transport system permease subunit